MATFLFTWELGAGLGHLVNLRPLVAGLAARGHDVAVAARDLSRARLALPDPRVRLFQAPFGNHRGIGAGEISTFAQLLRNVGFDNVIELSSLVEAWRNLFALVDPRVIVCEHSPTALLAARLKSLVASRGLAERRTAPAKRVLLNTGFFCPLDESPLPNLRPWIVTDPARLAEDERRVLDNINAIVERDHSPPLERVSQLYHPVDEHFLMTFRELDHYQGRTNVEYRGAWTDAGGPLAHWPTASGPKVFVYMKPCPALGQVFAALRKTQASVIAHLDGVDAQTAAQLTDERTAIHSAPISIADVARECDLAVLNGNHGTTVAMLLAGKPTLHAPIYLEQTHFMQAVVRLGAALGVSPGGNDPVESRLVALLDKSCYRQAAADFARRYAAFDPRRQNAAMLDRLEQLAAES